MTRSAGSAGSALSARAPGSAAVLLATALARRVFRSRLPRPFYTALFASQCADWTRGPDAASREARRSQQERRALSSPAAGVHRQLAGRGRRAWLAAWPPRDPRGGGDPRELRIRVRLFPSVP